MLPKTIPDFSTYIEEWNLYLCTLRQNLLLDEGSFINFAKDRGINVWGVGTGNPSEFHAHGWLKSDGPDPYGGLAFHPFRIYPLHKILNIGRLGIAASAVIRKEKLQELVNYRLAELPSLEQIGEDSERWNKVADLTILLEPLYWPQITGIRSWNDNLLSGDSQKDSLEEIFEQYRWKVLDMVRTLDPEIWKGVHEHLRIDAAKMDRNDELYLLLRLSKWDHRKTIVGQISGSLWLRHIAEVIRRAFEEVHSVKWYEEDRTFGTWALGSRKFFYGSERPLDDEDVSRPYVAWGFGLLTGSIVRWYVEGETEYGAVSHALANAPNANIELVNLHGNIASERDNAALKLEEWLKEDQSLRRFSIISFDVDVPANVKSIKRQIKQGNIVGYISANSPDFEFANFTVYELEKIVARQDEEAGFSSDSLHQVNWAEIKNGREFEARYKQVSHRKGKGLKGNEWGKALANYAESYPIHPDTKTIRPFWREIEAALSARFASYDFQKLTFSFNPDTFGAVDLRVEVEGVERDIGD